MINPVPLKIELYKFSLPFRTPFKTSNAVITNREGILIHYLDEDTQLSCWSEASPLPGFSAESVNDIIRASESILQSVYERKNLVANLPSLSFAVDCLLWRIVALETAAESIDKKASEFIPFPGSIPVNAAIGSGDVAQVLNTVNQYYSRGFRTFKFKVGVDLACEDKVLNEVQAAYPDVRIRLDANRAWSLDSALRILSEWKRFNPEYCEEPVHGGIREHMAEIGQSTGVPVAADESVRDFESARRLAEDRTVDFLILKPSLIGGFNEFRGICNLAKRSGLKIIVTTALESAIGRAWVYGLASTVNAGLAMGLATGHLFEYDLSDDSSFFSNGHLNFDPGLLYSLHPDKNRLKDIEPVWQS